MYNSPSPQSFPVSSSSVVKRFTTMMILMTMTSTNSKRCSSLFVSSFATTTSTSTSTRSIISTKMKTTPRRNVFGTGRIAAIDERKNVPLFMSSSNTKMGYYSTTTSSFEATVSTSNRQHTKSKPASLLSSWGNNKRAFSSTNHNAPTTTVLTMTADDENDDENDIRTKTLWDITGLKKETARQSLRCLKKVSKTSARLSKLVDQVEELRTDPDATLEQLEACPDVTSVEHDLEELRGRLKGLQKLEETLSVEYPKRNPKGKVGLEEGTLGLVRELGVMDERPERPPRGPKKKKGPRGTEPRKPYFRYYSKNDVEIRVGRRSTDNDELSTSPSHRDGADWWMHASSCPGSHVVIRCHDEHPDQDVVMDAAALAARQSKCEGSVIKVSLTRCRDVRKPYGAKAGLVQLVGKVRTVSVDMRKVEGRLARLDETSDNPNK